MRVRGSERKSLHKARGAAVGKVVSLWGASRGWAQGPRTTLPGGPGAPIFPPVP